MHLPAFDYIRPRSDKELCQILSDHGMETLVVAGGTDLFPRMKKGVTNRRILVDLKGIRGLQGVAEKGGEVLLGATLTLTALEKSTEMRKDMFALSQSAGRVGVTQLRNMGTIGGNLCQETRCWYYSQGPFWRRVNPPCFKRDGDRCYVVKGGDRCHAMFCGDMAPALIASGASLILKSREGERKLLVEDFYTGDGKEPLNLNPGEFLSRVVIQKDPSRKEVYLKLTARQTAGFPGVGVAASLHRVDGYCRDLKIAVTSVGPKPIRLKETERSLEGKRIESPVLEEVARFAYEEVHPVAFMGVGAAYRKKMVGVMVKRALELLSNIEGGKTPTT